MCISNSPLIQQVGRLNLIVLLLLFTSAISCPAYSLLTHEQIVDIAWKDQLEPMLKKRFPEAKPESLRKAHAYAYGGCLIQDIGYFPFGNEFFSDLAHYVRSGDFVANLIRESTDLDGYAFALGALAHYSSDISGHPIINHAVALSFPKLRAKHGDAVTFADNPKAHLQTEFGFDMVQVAKNRYSSAQYHDFIGFEVADGLLERALLKTYGLNLQDTLGPESLAIGTFRRSVSLIIPKMTHVALATRRPEIVKDVPDFNEKKFLFNLSRSEYEREWGKDYRRPSFGARILAAVLMLVPRIGPFKALDFKIPTTETEHLYIESVNKTVDTYRKLLRELDPAHPHLPNLDFDTGHKPRAGEYLLSDRAHLRLLDELSKRGTDKIDPDLRNTMLSFFNTKPILTSKKDRKAWCKTLEQLQELRAASPAVSVQ
jgi:hypothetical protein